MRLSCFSCGSPNLVKLEFGELVFVEGGKTREPSEKPLEQGENQHLTQPTYGTGPKLNLRHIGRRQVLSPPTSLIPSPCSPKF